MSDTSPPDRIIVGFVGLGHMGKPMAAQLAKAGFELVVFDVRRHAVDAFTAEHAATAASSAAEVFQASTHMITMLPDGGAVAAVIDAVLESATNDALDVSPPVVIDMSSSDPDGTIALGARLAVRGISLVDAPVSGGVPRAERGDLAILAGGEDADVERCRTVWGALGNSVFHVGGLGAGHAMKALNNMMSASGLLLAAETVLVGARFGLSPQTILAVLNASTGRNYSTEHKIEQFVLSGSYASGFSSELMLKDLRTAMRVAQSTATPTPLGAMVTEVWSMAQAQLPHGADQMRVVEWLENLTDTVLGHWGDA